VDWRKWQFPLISLALCAAAYGLLIRGLGYYWDDWMIPAIIKNGMSFWTFYQYNRPLSAWTFELLAPILGLNPFGWHLANLIMRWVTGLTAWWMLSTLWPNQRRAIKWMLYLFLISPAFLQQVFAATYVQHFLIFPFFFISCASMMLMLRGGTMQAARRDVISPRRFFYGAISLLTEIVHVFSMEYFWGFELIRPYLIWKSIPASLGTRRRLINSFIAWIPYLVIFIAAIIWRFKFAQIAEEDPNSLRLFFEFFSTPIQTILSFAMIVMRDMVYLFISSWYPALQTAKMDYQPMSLLVSWGLVIITSGLLWWFFRKEEISDSEDWAREAAWFGLYTTVVGMLPTWAVSRQLTVGAFADRLALPSIFGVGILVVALTRLIVQKRSVQVLLLSILIGFAVGYHFRLDVDYRWYWERQARFFWQYAWRVPGLEKDTAILADGAQLPRVSDYAMSLALNTLNAPASVEDQQPYWFFELDRNFTYDLKALFSDFKIDDHLRNLYFEGRGKSSIVIMYQEGQCLWLLDESDKLNASLPALTLKALPVSDPSRVLADAEPDTAYLTAIFGPEPKHDWCYYYEKANIAYHQQDWKQVLDFYKQADDSGLKTKIGFELKPFVVANAKLGQWEQARDLTLLAFERDVTSKALYCSLWLDLVSSSSGPDVSNGSFTNVMDTLRCKQP
jgi:hypothetical protein